VLRAKSPLPLPEDPDEGLQRPIPTAPSADRPLVGRGSDVRPRTTELEAPTVTDMTVRVAISEPRLLSALARLLEAHACIVRALSDRAFEMTTLAKDADHTRMEVEFFFRAWQNAHPDVYVLVG
jgi:hypothetical protein